MTKITCIFLNCRKYTLIRIRAWDILIGRGRDEQTVTNVCFWIRTNLNLFLICSRQPIFAYKSIVFPRNALQFGNAFTQVLPFYQKVNFRRYFAPWLCIFRRYYVFVVSN